VTDRIFVQDLLVAATVGVPDLERVAPQSLLLQVVLESDFRGLGDDLARTADYAAVCEWLRCQCLAREFQLIESLVDHLATGLLSEFPPVRAVELEICKFILPATRQVAVRVRRERT
tara:strand:- start:198 stop:548 length:351 start_codon:yes stop_codon:yes gene_type:complete